jgi:uncharacterized protein
VDEDLRVTLKDIGEKSVVREIAISCGTPVKEMHLTSQFRCNGLDGYLSGVNNVPGISSTANTTPDGIDCDVRVYESPNALHDEIRRADSPGNRSSVVAGYCQDWKGEKGPAIKDVAIFQYGCFARRNMD